MSSSEPSRPTRRWRLDIAYDGRGLNGFAHQPGVPTVVGLLRETLARTLRLESEPFLTGAGRTDTGVHAFAQVVHLDLPADVTMSHGPLDPARLMRAVNLQLRGRVRVLAMREVDAEFDARRSALWREYRYLVLEAQGPGLHLQDAFAWTVEGPLDLAAMTRASAAILGTHDFRAFCRRPVDKSPDEPLVRRVISAEWTRREDTWTMSPERGAATVFTIRAQAFCHNMVRSLTSTLVAIGRGELPEDEVVRRRASRRRDHLPPPAPAAGLALVGVGYPELAGGASGFVG